MTYRDKNTRFSRENSPLAAPKPISGVVDRLVAGLGISRRYYGWRIVTEWPNIVGKQLAKVSKAIRFDEDGVLYVAVANDTWRQEIAMQTDAIMAKIRACPNGTAVKELRLVRGEKGI